MGYLYYNNTGVDKVDSLLNTLSSAGKAFHHTDQWDDEIGEMYAQSGNTPNEWIQNSANDLAKYVKELEEKGKSYEK